MSARLRSAAYPFALFAINLAVSWRYFRAGYVNQLPSIEGVFIAFEQYIQRHWPTYDWFALWYGGMPFTRVYQPGLHYAAAALATLTQIPAVHAYHALTAITYSLGGAGFYYLAKALLSHEGKPIAPRATAFLGALLFSLFSPSTLVSRDIRADAGGILHPRRLQALTIYGEGPNVTGLTLGMFAMAAIHAAFRRRTPLATCIAGAAVALVPMVSWPATVALTVAIFCYLAALEWSNPLDILLRLSIVGLLAFGFASPFAPPSTILGTFAQANVMDEAPTPGPARWIAFALLAIAFAAARFLLVRRRADFSLRFTLLWTLFTAWLVMSASSFGVRMIPFPLRFHLAMEIPAILAATCLGAMLPRRRLLAGIVLLFCLAQFYMYRRWLHANIAPIDIAGTAEYQMAKWTEANLHGQRIFTRGTFGLWLNAFSDTPQVSGFFDQSISNPMDRHASFLLAKGYLSDKDSADYSLLWLKAFGAAAIHIEGPNSADYYKDFRFPDRFKGLLPVLWSRGDDVIYGVPERFPGIARAVPVQDLVRHVPANAVDDRELKPFVAALDDPSLSQARFHWQGANRAQVTGSFEPGQAIALAINY
ncbi:MAG: hypothetical protein KGN84_08975, partial [Acidobacteriota bacterium]|nr:hypothetical protein [Acidobacteriota bacterium]